MFEERLIFPRKRFKQKFPKNKIVFSIDEADVFVMDTRKFERSMETWRVSTICGVEKPPIKGWRTGYWYHASNLSAKDLPQDTGESRKMLNISEHELEQKKNSMNNMLTILEKGVRVVDFRAVKFSSENSMDQESFDRIKAMFNGEGEMMSLAMNMLTAYDFESEKLHMALLLHGNPINNWRWNKDKKSNVEIKNFLKQLEASCPQLWYSRGSSESIKWYLQLLLEHPEDEIIQKAANHHLRMSVWHDMPDLNITQKQNEEKKSNPVEHSAAGAA